jgi:hypothetical protein
MKRLIIATVAAISLASIANSATMVFKKYRDEQRAEFRAYDRVYLDGVREGIIAYDTFIRSGRTPPFMCMPGQTALTLEQADGILMREAQQHANIYTDNTPISVLLMYGLIETFPCDGSNKQ